MAFPEAYPLFPIVSFIGFVMSLIPFPWHLQSWNSGTCFFMFWTSLACLNHFVNAVVWADNFHDHAPWWCEISIRITLGASVGIPASSLCIVRRLYSIASIQQVSTSRAEKRRFILIDALICILYPIIYIALQYVVQGHRYNIVESIGCYPALYNTIVTYFISYSPPLVTGLISAVYCVLALHQFNHKRLQFAALLRSSPSLTMSRYLRLMGLACSELLCTTPICAFVIYVNSTSKLQPYISWEDTHYMYSRVEVIPYAILRTRQYAHIGMELTRWLAPFSAFVFFGFFGFAEEARKNYAKAFAFASKLFRSASSPSFKSFSNKEKIAPISKCASPRPRSSTTESSTSTLPVYASPSKSIFELGSLGDASVQRTDSVTTLQSPSPVYPSKGYHSSHSRKKPDLYYSCSEGPLSPTLTANSLPEYESKWGERAV